MFCLIKVMSESCFWASLICSSREGLISKFDRKPEGTTSRLSHVMSMHFYSCRHLLGLQVQRFVEQQQVSLKWITQGLSNSGRKRSKLSLSNNPAITIQKVSCVPNTPNTLVRCIGALVRRRDNEIQVIWMIISSNFNLKLNLQQVNM